MEYESLLRDFQKGSDRIKSILAAMPDLCIDFKPERKEGWSVRQHLIHLVDSDINNFIRIKSCLAQPGSDVYVINEDEWVRNLGDAKESLEEYLEVFALLRKILYNLLIAIPEDQFKKLYFVRNYNGEVSHVTLSDSLEMYRDHVTFHLEYIQQNIDEFNKIQ